MGEGRTKVAFDMGQVNNKDPNVTQRLYNVDPPMPYGRYGDENPETTEFVVVSAAMVLGQGPETYIFAATEDGEICDFLELAGSYKGGLDHEKALDNAGYKVVPVRTLT